MASDYPLPEHPACPFCDASDTELHSAFGSALSVSTYWCRRCRTAFEWVKGREPAERPERPEEEATQ